MQINSKQHYHAELFKSFSPVSPKLRRVKNRKRSENFEIFKYDGLRARRMGRPDYAIKCFTEALAIEEDFETMGYLSQLYIPMGETEKARELLEKMAVMEPHVTSTFLTLANVCYIQEDYKAMEEAAGKAIAIEEGNAVAHFLLGKARKGQDDEIMTIAHLTKAITLKDDFIEARLMRAEALLKMKQYKETMEDIDAVLAQNPEEETAILLRGKVKEANGQEEEAEADYQLVTEVNPFNEQAYLYLGQLFINQKKLTEAISLFDEAIELNPNFAEAYKVIGQSSALPAVCGRVCPQETQCEGKCIRGIKGEAVSIGKLERFVADWAKENGIKPEAPAEKNGHKVAVIGSGPSGLTCAGDLAKLGYDVTIFEALHQAGGVLVYGIPEFRLPKDKVVKAEVENVKSLGVKINTNVIIGKSTTVDELMENEGFEAVFIGSGAGLPMFMGIPGEVSNGVFSANEYLTRSNLMKAFRDDHDTPIVTGKKVVVVGGGNVAMDAARTALRLGAEVHIVYRRSEEELPARREEVHHAKEEGVIFDLLTNPTEIVADEKGWVKAIKCVRMELGEPDASGRRRPVVIEGSEFEMDVDTVIMSLGTSPNPLISSTTIGLDINKRKCIIADEEFGKTSKEGVYAGGDAVTGAATVILAMGAGKAGARGIDEYIKSKYAK